MASQGNKYSDNSQTQGEPPHVSRTPRDREAKLLPDALKMAKAISKKRPGRMLPEGEDSRDITIKRLQAPLVDLRDLMFQVKMFTRLEDDIKQAEKATGMMTRDIHLKEFIDEEKTQAKKVKVRLNPRFDRGDNETDKAMDEEEKLPLGTIHMIGGPNHPDFENRIQGEIRMVKQMHEVLMIQSSTKKPRQVASELGSFTFTKADLERVQHPHSDLSVIHLRMNNYNM
ncbi:hypothetical protein Acr_02g0011290 [Actinidia rufa]|uniref:Uncharacterized protein n=1 Tax=Actinidia rufa TaxID=165716 RepID=A0A7J0EAD3_9ERIC|nr:hypothetical protein Acr_02g0011290 [Actinidia rufa]